VIAICVTVRALLPVLVNVTCTEWTVLTGTLPKFTLAGTSFTVPIVRVTAAPPVLLGSLTEVATIATAGLGGTVDGAVYVVASPLPVFVGDTLPHTGEQGTLFCVGVQVTPLFGPSFLTLAVNCCVALTPISAEAGDTDTEIGGGTIVTVADADLLVSDTEVAVSVTAGFAGGDAGAK
jgi:hypothetical protein